MDDMQFPPAPETPETPVHPEAQTSKMTDKDWEDLTFPPPPVNFPSSSGSI
jgi:hypothetical protein